MKPIIIILTMITCFIIIIIGTVKLIPSGNERFEHRRIDVGNGKTVECIVYHSGFKSGISCNW